MAGTAVKITGGLYQGRYRPHLFSTYLYVVHTWLPGWEPQIAASIDPPVAIPVTGTRAWCEDLLERHDQGGIETLAKFLWEHTGNENLTVVWASNPSVASDFARSRLLQHPNIWKPGARSVPQLKERKLRDRRAILPVAPEPALREDKPPTEEELRAKELAKEIAQKSWLRPPPLPKREKLKKADDWWGHDFLDLFDPGRYPISNLDERRLAELEEAADEYFDWHEEQRAFCIERAVYNDWDLQRIPLNFESRLLRRGVSFKGQLWRSLRYAYYEERDERDWEKQVLRRLAEFEAIEAEELEELGLEHEPEERELVYGRTRDYLKRR